MKLNRRILLVTCCVLFISLLAGSVVNILDFRRNYTEALITGSHGLGQSLGSIVSEMLDLGLPLDSLSGMERKVKQLVENNAHIGYAQISDMDGRILYHSNPEMVGRVLSDEVMKHGIAATAPLTQSYLRFDGQEYFDVTLPIFDSGRKHIGAIRLGFRSEIVNAKVRDAVSHVVVNVTLSFLIIAFLINALLSRLVSRPVIALSDRARWIADGQFDLPVPAVARSDEIGLLSGSLDSMAATIKAQLEALKKSRDDLEQLVAARTSELAVANGDLMQKNKALVQTIAERKQTEAELLRSNAELEQFSYSISHDMRQPLRMISSYLQLLDIGLADKLDEEKREYLNFAADGAKRLDQM
ncbi:MAG: HAMP domain-containing protein, partial [Proteobacteria bacterium]|nr:HAMP domain-containing protein [Pseudomonadota bacterium]